MNKGHGPPVGGCANIGHGWWGVALKRPVTGFFQFNARVINQGGRSGRIVKYFILALGLLLLPLPGQEFVDGMNVFALQSVSEDVVVEVPSDMLGIS